MARPERRNVDYFPHYLSEGKKMYLIEHKYGNDGYAVWFKLLETLASTDDHWLNLNDETNVMFMSAKCRVSEDVLFSILDDLSKLDEINSLLWKDKIVWSDKFTESIQDAYARRNNKCMKLDSLCKHLSSLGLHKPSNCTLKGSNKPQSKVKEIKVKENKQEVDVKSFLNWFNSMKLKYKGKEGKFKTLNATDINNLKQLKELKYTSEEWEHAFKMMINSDWVKENGTDTPTHFLVNTNFDKYLNQEDKVTKQPLSEDKIRYEHVMKQMQLNK